MDKKLKNDIETLYQNIKVRQLNLRREIDKKEAKIEALRETELQMEKFMGMLDDE